MENTQLQHILEVAAQTLPALCYAAHGELFLLRFGYLINHLRQVVVVGVAIANKKQSQRILLCLGSLLCVLCRHSEWQYQKKQKDNSSHSFVVFKVK